MNQNVPGLPIIKMFSKHNETLLRTLHAEVRILAIYAKYVATPTKSKNYIDGCQNIGKTAVAGVSMEKNEKISVSIDHLYTISKKEVTGEFFLCSCHACLPATMATAPYHGRSMLATRPTSSSHNSVSIVL